ncbi:MAG: nSTAND1 domain-containing NTPase [Gammaproteobacteria bacterium]
MSEHPVASDHAVTLDPENPWLGLFSYTEETCAYFHGRDEEAAELARRVQRTILTVLFGQSGLGKTSLLRAGLVPRLRNEGYCPVYVRIDYAAGSPTPSEQIKQAIFRATEAAGHWARPGASIEGESLWEFLHHRGDLLRDAQGGTLMPLLIFDQFEEIFTLGQADDAGKLRAQQFLAELADLVENRAPTALEARLEDDDRAAEDFDFARADYRVLIALREDYLAHLESLKGSMPSITQNRMRLARMNGAQALSAVLKPGSQLVSREVAESIVRFVAGGSELANAEVEPSLLSLVCRELNTLRQTQGRKEISTDLLAGSRDTILSEFYERTLSDQPAGVRRVIEDELLTESGYRESLAEERIAKVLAAVGAAPDTLATLVNRRLLRIEDRLDMRRVELTHDVLCKVVLASRNLRREREAREQAERELAAQREREAATHRALRRTRIVAGVCAGLMLVAIVGALFGWYNLQRARAAQAEVQAARTNAENLVSFLIEDFYNELAPTGRLETLGKLAQKTITYYDSLPPELVTQQTQINRAMALVRLGSAQMSSGHQQAATKSFGEARAAFEKLRAEGEDGEPVIYGLALILYNEGSLAATALNGSSAPLDEAAALLQPLVNGANPSRQVRQLYADDLNMVCLTQPPQQALATCDEALKILEGLGALNLSDLNAAASWADTADTKAGQLQALGRTGEAQALEQQVFTMTEKVLVRRPGDLHALEDRFFAASRLAGLAWSRHAAATAANYANQAVQAAQDLVRFNPSSVDAWSRWAQALDDVATIQFERGEITRAIATQRSALALVQAPHSPQSLAAAIGYLWRLLALNQALSGDTAGAEQSLQSFLRVEPQVAAGLPPRSPQRLLAGNAMNQPLTAGNLKLDEGAPQPALAEATVALARIEAVQVPATDANTLSRKNAMLEAGFSTAALASVRLGRYAQAETLARQWLAVAPVAVVQRNPKPRESEARYILAQVIAMQGRTAEARNVLQPALDYYRQQFKTGASGTTFRHDYAYALYVSAIAQPESAAGRRQRRTGLAEALRLLAGASAEAQRLTPMRYLAGLIAAARAGSKG